MRLEHDRGGERLALADAGVLDPEVQACLAWRRSRLLVVAAALVPICLFQTTSTIAEWGDFAVLNLMTLLQLVIHVGLAALRWWVLRRWTDWRGPLRRLVPAWAVWRPARRQRATRAPLTPCSGAARLARPHSQLPSS